MPDSHRVAVFFQHWVCRIFWLVRTTANQTWNNCISAAPLNFRAFHRHKLQGLHSNVCVHYCCLYAFHRARGLPMLSFVNMFIGAHYTCNDKVSSHVRRSVLRLFRMRPVSAPVVVQNIGKVRTLGFYQSTMSLLVIDFTYFEGRDGDIVFKELAAVDFQINRFSSYAFKRPYGWEELPMFNARMNQAIIHWCIWNDGGVLYSELENGTSWGIICSLNLLCWALENKISVVLLSIHLLISLRMPCTRRRKSASHQLRVSMSQV